MWGASRICPVRLTDVSGQILELEIVGYQFPDAQSVRDFEGGVSPALRFEPQQPLPRT